MRDLSFALSQSNLPIFVDFFFRIFIGESQLRIGLVVRVASQLLHVFIVAPKVCYLT
ncbi:hypothetical protein DEO72_LG3g1738 [Vigna unguiculata]|uniref:Uncharacterized protein n=1 Tax=Vigna unguiculata TaxID=3917 RepID=A0A4D6LGB1_VIGUN|nr:hypothetical protein DEO72_LG3g1738 [Vigna unguiculata]